MITININQTAVHLKLRGRFQVKQAAILREKTLELTNNGHRNFVFDIQHLDHLDTTGLGVLIGIQNLVAGSNGSVKVTGAQGMVDELFSRTRLKEVFYS